MAEIFKKLPKVRYEGAESKNPLAFKFYDADRMILGKKMSEHLPFAMAWWHNLGNAGKDMFGDPHGGQNVRREEKGHHGAREG